MTKHILLIIITLLSCSILKSQNIDTTISIYNFNNLSAANISGQDFWQTTLIGTNIDVQVQAGYSHDGSNAARFTQTGGNINASGNRQLDSIFPGFNYADSGLYYFYFDVKREFWGTEFGIAYDQDNNGLINNSANKILTMTM